MGPSHLQRDLFRKKIGSKNRRKVALALKKGWRSVRGDVQENMTHDE